MSQTLIALMAAINARDPQAAALALKEGADINGQLKKGASTPTGYVHPDVPPVTWATRKAPKMIPWLVARGAKLEQRTRSSKETPIITAARQGLALKSIQVLIKAGANLDAVDNEGQSALHFAARQGKLKVVQALLKAGANPNLGKQDDHFGLPDTPTYTPLYEACGAHQQACAMALLDAGANPNTGKTGRVTLSPLGLAVNRQDQALCERLLMAGARTDEEVLSEPLRKELEALVGSLPKR